MLQYNQENCGITLTKKNIIKHKVETINVPIIEMCCLFFLIYQVD